MQKLVRYGLEKIGEQASVCARMHVESAVVHVCKCVCVCVCVHMLPQLLCVCLQTEFQTLNGGEKRVSLALYKC